VLSPAAEQWEQDVAGAVTARQVPDQGTSNHSISTKSEMRYPGSHLSHYCTVTIDVASELQVGLSVTCCCQ